MDTWTDSAGPRSRAASSEGAASCPLTGGGVRECRWAERRTRRCTRPLRLVAAPRVALRTALAAVVIKSPKLVAVSKGAARCVVARTICRVKERLGRFGYLLSVAGSALENAPSRSHMGATRRPTPPATRLPERGPMRSSHAVCCRSSMRQRPCRQRLTCVVDSSSCKTAPFCRCSTFLAERAVAMFKMASGQWGAHGGPHRLHTTDRPPRSMPALANGGARSCPLTATRSFTSPPNGSHGGVRVSCMARNAISPQQPLRMGSRRGFC